MNTTHARTRTPAEGSGSRGIEGAGLGGFVSEKRGAKERQRASRSAPAMGKSTQKRKSNKTDRNETVGVWVLGFNNFGVFVVVVCVGERHDTRDTHTQNMWIGSISGGDSGFYVEVFFRTGFRIG